MARRERLKERCVFVDVSAYSGEPVLVEDEGFMAGAGCTWATTRGLAQRGGKNVGDARLVEVMAAKHPARFCFEPEIGAAAQVLAIQVLRAAFTVAEGAPIVSDERGIFELGTAAEDFLPTDLHVQTKQLGADQHRIAIRKSRNDIRMTFHAAII